MTTKPAIIVCAYNRSNSLIRLLQSIAGAVYQEYDIPLIISIDKSENQDVIKIAETFKWEYGPKKIISHKKHLGLKQHILLCADFTNEYNAIVVLEDDLLVSPYFYNYALQASNFYKDDHNIAGISLYNYQVAESCFYPFKAIDDGSDVYFMQVASSWGQLWTKQQWVNFKNWFANNPELIKNDAIPNYLFQWGIHSWKKHFIHYLIATKKYFVFPRLSLTTNFEEPGTNASSKNVFHVPLQLSNYTIKFQKLENSKSIYDAWFEINPNSLNHFNSSLKKFNYSVDLYGKKQIDKIGSSYILTTKETETSSLSFGSDLFPLESNIACNLIGNSIKLSEIRDNTFRDRKLHLKNYLEVLNINSDLSIAIIIPIIQINTKDLKATLNSLIKQEYNFLQLILVTNSSLINQLEFIISDYKLNIKIINCESKLIDEYVQLGFENTNKEIATYITQGYLFNKQTLNHVNSIFKSYAHINWICGTNEEISDKYKYDRLDVLDYRIAPIQIYKRVKNHTLNYFLTGHFYRKNCIAGVLFNSFTLKKMFLHLINAYQLTVVVKCLVSNEGLVSLSDFSTDEKNELIAKYKPMTSIDIIKAHIINYILKMKFIGHASHKWFYVTNFNFPDVLRYDFVNKTFYLHKY